MSPNPIPFSEIKAWARLTGRRPTPFEVRVIRRLDMAMLSDWTKKQNGGEPKGTPGVRNEVKASDSAGVASLMAGFNARKKAAEPKPKPTPRADT